jgi:hypothetical protein
MNLYRVTAFDPKTSKEFNVGLFVAESREEALRRAADKRSERMVLDTIFVSKVEGVTDQKVKDYLSKIGSKGGKLGGKSKSAAKRRAVRENGKKGGRPRGTLNKAVR